MKWFDEITQQQASLPGEAPTWKWWNEIKDQPGTRESMGPSPKLPSFVGEDPARMAGFGTQAAASLPTDETARIRYFASKRFPGLSSDKAMENYFIKDGRLAYRDPTGAAYYEEPAVRPPTSGANMGQNALALAGKVGPGISTIPAVVAGVASALEGPPGWATGLGQTALAASAGDATRQGLAHVIAGEEKPWIERAWQNAGNVAEQEVGQVFGNTVGMVLRMFGRTPTFDIPATTALRDSSNRWGISLTPGEETGNRTLLRRQKILANTTEGEQRFTDFYTGRNEQVRGAVDELLGKLSSERSPHMGSYSGVEGAQAALSANRKELAAKARPLYEKHVDNNTQRFWTPEVEGLFSRPSMQDAIGAARKLAAEEGRTITVPAFENGKRAGNDIVPDWRSWDYIKKALDGIVEEHTNEVGRVSQYGRAVANTRGDLLGILDKANPGYAEARGVFSENVPVRTALETGPVGSMARLQGDDVNRAGSVIFGKNSSPEDIRFARQAFQKAEKMSAWDDMAAAHLRQVFNEIPDSSTGSITNLGGTFRKAILGNERKRQAMEAAFEHRPEFWNDVMDLSKVLDATGRAMKGESITAFAQAGQKELANESKGIVPAAIETIEFWKTPGRVAQYMNDLRASKYADRQAQLLTTPEGRETMRELKRLGPTSAASVMILSKFLTGAGSAQAQDYLEPPKTGAVSVRDGRVSLAP